MNRRFIGETEEMPKESFELSKVIKRLGAEIQCLCDDRVFDDTTVRSNVIRQVDIGRNLLLRMGTGVSGKSLCLAFGTTRLFEHAL